MTLGARVVAFDSQSRVLLVRHTYISGWHFPGGGVDPGETAEQAAARELREEANIELAGPLALHGVFFNARASKRDHIVVFVARDVLQTSMKRADREIREVEFFALSKLPQDVNRAVADRLAEIQGLAKPSPFW